MSEVVGDAQNSVFLKKLKNFVKEEHKTKTPGSYKIRLLKGHQSHSSRSLASVYSVDSLWRLRSHAIVFPS